MAPSGAPVDVEAGGRGQLNVLSDVGRGQMVEALVGGENEANSPADVTAVKVQTDQLASIMKSIGQLKEGNVLTFDFVDGATKVGLNGSAKGSIAGEAFNTALMNAWLGDNPVQADLKKGMLGGG